MRNKIKKKVCTVRTYGHIFIGIFNGQDEYIHIIPISQIEAIIEEILDGIFRCIEGDGY